MNYIFGGLSVIIVLYSIFIIVYRIIEKNGFKLKKKIIKKESKSNIELATKNECIKVFGTVFSFRIIIFLLSILIFYMIIRKDSIINITQAINNWVKWDANNYLRIAKGYSSYMENGIFTTLVFFPLYPAFIFIFKLLFNEVIAGLLISNISFSIASIFIYKLVAMDYDKKTAKITLLILNIFPFSFFFSSIMSESVFLLFSSLTLYYIRKHKWLLVGIFGLLTTLSRSIGVFIFIPAFVELIEEYQLIKKIKNYRYVIKTLYTKFTPLLLIPLGIVIYLYINYHVTGDWFYFLKIQSSIWAQSYKSFPLFFDTCFNMIKYFDYNVILTIAIPQIIVVLCAYIILGLSVKKHITMYSVWLLINIIFNTSISWPLSVCRYFCCAIPLFIFLADYLKKRNELLIVYVLISLLLLGIFFTAYLSGSYIF